MSIETKSGNRSERTRGVALSAVRGLAVALVALPGAVLCFCLALVSIALVPIGVGIVTTPWVLTGVRAFADWRRLLAARWGGVRIPRAYRPLPADANPWARTFGMLRDPATWRDLLWLPVDMTAGFVTALLAFALALYPLEGFAIAAGLWRVLPEGYWYGFVRVTDQTSALYAAGLGAVLLAAAYRLTPLLLRAHFRLTGAVLGSGQGELAERVRVLTETRRDAVDTSAAELRRIERDLHDGAQARLVAMGMDLGTIESTRSPRRATTSRGPSPRRSRTSTPRSSPSWS
ncbi:sensor domain-containing protein, partial [Streptomyces sp. NPDC005047]